MTDFLMVDSTFSFSLQSKECMMRFEMLTLLALSVCSSFVVGCAEKPAPNPPTSSVSPAASASKGDDPKITAAMEKLPEDERALAIAQKYCAVSEKSRLGSMGTPYKIMVEGQPVFLCCAGCEDEALKDPQATLAKVESLKKAAAQP
jgi:hypothetical protein